MKLSTLSLGLALSSALVIGAGAANAATLTFDSVADCNSSDVTITGGTFGQACGIGGSPNGTSALVRSTVGSPLESYWVAEFVSDVSNVSIDLGDFAADADRLFLWAWDAANVLLGFTELDITDTDETMHTLTLGLSGIRSISFGTIGALFPGDPNGLGLGGIYADNLTYTPAPPEVPLPAALPLLATGLGALGFAGWRRKQSAAKA